MSNEIFRFNVQVAFLIPLPNLILLQTYKLILSFYSKCTGTVNSHSSTKCWRQSKERKTEHVVEIGLSHNSGGPLSRNLSLLQGSTVWFFMSHKQMRATRSRLDEMFLQPDNNGVESKWMRLEAAGIWDRHFLFKCDPHNVHVRPFLITSNKRDV